MINGLQMKMGCSTLCGRYPAMAFLIILMIGCTGLTINRRVDKFSETAEAYQQALELSEFRAASKFLDKSKDSPPLNLLRFANIKIVRYEVTRIHVSEDKRLIEQDVELQYFLLDRNVVKAANDHQVWEFKDKADDWQLLTGLPVLVR